MKNVLLVEILNLKNEVELSFIIDNDNELGLVKAYFLTSKISFFDSKYKIATKRIAIVETLDDKKDMVKFFEVLIRSKV